MTAMPDPFRLLAPKPRGLERDAVELALADGRRVQVARVRDPRARRLRLSVDERGARLTLPPRASLAAGERFLAEHRDWLAVQLAQYACDAIAPLQRDATATLPLRSARLPLRWESGRYARLRRTDTALVFAAPAGADDAALRRALRDFYTGEARADLGRWLPRQLPSLPRPPRRVQFKVMSSQWGSLAPDGSVALDLSLVLARPSAFQYVLVHELCHLIRPDHSRTFWREVETRCPAWRAERDYFHAEGRRLKATLRILLGN
nr:SprT family zinc-dependent metalloprotease [Luteimonas weifangensis]